MLNWLPNGIKTWVVVGVGALVLALSAFFILSNFSPDATFAQAETISYAENGTGPVLTYTSMDPEGMGIDWSLTGPDAGSFTISGGALKFMDPPDYESPKDVARAVGIDFNGNVSIEDPGEDAAMAMDNEYEVVVMATERRASGNAGPAKSSSTAVKVMVMNVNETGAVTMQWRQPEVGTQISALVTDPDVTATATATLTVSVWQWDVSKVQVPSITDVNHWEEAGTGSDMQEYTPAESDKGKFLRITATYAVVEGAQTMEAMAQMMSDNRVRADVARADNASPDFRGGEAKRSVDENAPVGTFVGMPVVGYDPDKDTLTYSLEATPVVANAGDVAKFSIDRASGQISVNGTLDADTDDGRTGEGIKNGKYVVVARVTDPSEDYIETGARSSDTITVTITANQVNENPSVEGTAEFVIDQGMNLPDAGRPGAATYRADDPDAQTNINWVLAGEDADDFRLAGTDARTLKFASDPDYEMPGDDNGDNVYMVMVVATDGSAGGRGEKMVTVTVRNTDQGGEVTLSSAQPHLGVPLTAMLDDPDRGVSIVSWQWASAPSTTPDGVWTNIAGATSATYTPSTNDTGVGIGNYLRVTVTYTDPFSANDDPNTDEDERITAPESVKTLPKISDNAIQAPPGVSMVPEFPASASRRAVAENTAPGGNVGDPVLAMDPDSDDVLTYSLGGRDARYFAIDPRTGQITIGGVTEPDDGKTDPVLNYERAPKSYTVDVSATDTAGEKGTVTVIISVTDRNEPPVFTKAPAAAIQYAENGTGPVHTFRAPDPEGRGEKWDVTGPDAAQFTISGGVLRFRNSPDEENPTDIESDNNYVIMVRASERRVAGYGGPAKSTELNVTVTVTDVNEDPTVGMKWRQPEVGTPIMATLTDPDSESPGPTWVWSVSKVQAGINIDDEDHWDAATGTVNEAIYTPADVDEGKFLRATANYNIGGVPHGPARVMSEFRVREDVLSSENASPDFTGGATERSVDENAAVGTAVDAPVVITDPDPDGDTVTYSLETAGGDNLNDFNYFSINKVTGQISVKQRLDADKLDEDRTAAMVGKYVVVARVTDPSAARDATNSNSSDMITVIITANQVNENPSVEGPVELTVDENTNLPAADDTDAATYMATDQDALTNINWELAGEDADDFRISGTGARTLRFASEPDYEMPTDANGDNVYKVMVVATDGSSGRGVGHVSVTVENVGEDGEVMLSAAQPHLGTPITAILSDPDIPDGEVTVSWQWMRSRAEAAMFEPIPGATTNTYTPVRLEMGDAGYYLRATAMYRDATSDPNDLEQMIPAMETSANAVLATPATQNAPEFASATMDREVVENAPSTTVVGPPVTATDPDMTDVLTYKLGGADAVSFDIDMETGQITVTLGTMLNYETKKTYTVEVTATDSTKLIDMVTVTIMVTNVNEMPSMPKELFGDLAITGPTSMDYEEGMTAAIGTYVAVGPVAGMATWSLSGDDMGDFYISNMGELTFASVPDFEMPMDMDMDNMYEITVMGNDGTNPAVGYDVIVAVTNMDEMGEVTLWDGMDALTMAPQVGDTITGAVMDPDGGVMVESWQWARTMDPADMASWMDIQDETDAAYTVTDDDAGYYLRATATYTDGEGMGKMASEETMMVGAEAGDPLLAKYDGDKDGWIQLEEARDAVGDYFAPPKGEKLSLDDTRKVVGLYFLYKNRQQ